MQTQGKGEELKKGEFRVMLFLACSDDATDTAVGTRVCVWEKKGVKNLFCVCMCVCVTFHFPHLSLIRPSLTVHI